MGLHAAISRGMSCHAAGAQTQKDEASTPWMDRLMDVLLSLLAKGAAEQLPFAPLREAIESLFKHCCPALTSTGKHCYTLVLQRSMILRPSSWRASLP